MLREDLSDPEAAAQRFSDQQKQRIRKYYDLEQRVSLDGARAVLEVPVASCLREIVEHSPQKVRDWLTWILAVDSEVVLRQLFNIGVGLAASFARLDGELSASVLTRLEQTEPFVRVVEGRQQISGHALQRTMASHPGECAGDRGVHPRK